MGRNVGSCWVCVSQAPEGSAASGCVSSCVGGRLRPETPEPRASLGKTYLNGMTAPPEDGFGPQRVAPQYFKAISALKARLVAPVLLEAAKRKSTI